MIAGATLDRGVIDKIREEIDFIMNSKRIQKTSNFIYIGIAILGLAIVLNIPEFSILTLIVCCILAFLNAYVFEQFEMSEKELIACLRLFSSTDEYSKAENAESVNRFVSISVKYIMVAYVIRIINCIILLGIVLCTALILCAL